MYTEYCVLVKAHEDTGNSTFSHTVQYKLFRSAWYAFLALLEINYTNWMKFIQCISSTSPVSALIPPTDEALELVEELCKRDVTSDPKV